MNHIGHVARCLPLVLPSPSLAGGFHGDGIAIEIGGEHLGQPSMVANEVRTIRHNATTQRG